MIVTSYLTQYFISHTITNMASTMERAKEESEKNYKFVELLQQYPAVWDIKSKDYKDRHLKRKGYEEIASELDWTVAQVIEKYKNLRTYYTKERRKVDSSMKSGAGTTEIYKSKWEFFDALDSFLRDTLKVRGASSNLDLELKGSDNEDEDVLAEEGSCNTTKSHYLTPQSKRKRPRKEDELVLQALDILKSPVPSNQKQEQPKSKDAIFGTLIVSLLEDIPEGKKKETLKVKMHQLIIEAKFDEPEPQVHFRPFLPIPTLNGNLLRNGHHNYSPTQSSESSYQTSFAQP